MIQSLGHIRSPTQILRREIDRFAAGSSELTGISFCFDVDCYWLEDHSATTLLAACQFSKQSDQIHIAVALTERINAVDSDIRQANPTFLQLCDRHELSVLDLSKPLRLETVNIPKPWGREIWYTGIEKRGVCSVQGIPLPWITAFYPAAFDVQNELILLKILDPLPAEVHGDLYYEMHREKTEVYIVTHVDETAWPTGVGKIRYGFDATKLAQYGSDGEFRSAYLAAVQTYRGIRQQIDVQLDSFREQEGYASNDPIPPDLLNRWLDRLSPELITREHKFRADMDAFTHMRSLKVGDVLRVEPFTPHALQHGVRTIEFQTPHYERQILSFAQKVLTQNHWDTEEAVDDMIIRSARTGGLPIVFSEAGAQIQSVAEFPQFSVQRLTLEPGASYTYTASSYGLTIGISGICQIIGENLTSEQAYLIPAHLPARTFVNNSAETSVCLLAFPSNQ